MYMYSILDIYTHIFTYIYILIYMVGLFIPDLLTAKTFVKWAVHLPASFLEIIFALYPFFTLPSQSCYRRGNQGSTSRTPVSSSPLKAVKCLSIRSANISELYPHASRRARLGKGNTTQTDVKSLPLQALASGMRWDMLGCGVGDLRELQWWGSEE